jgi:uridine phosphorylase
MVERVSQPQGLMSDFANVLIQPQKVGSIVEANFPKDAEGRVYHLGVKRGEVCNRILSVGDPQRAALIAKMLDNHEKAFVRASNRGFVVYTGKKNKIPVTIIATGMGIAMMDFVVRESRAVVDGPMIMIRFGTCGSINPNFRIGSIAVCTESIGVFRNYDAFHFENQSLLKTTSSLGTYYLATRPIQPDRQLCEWLKTTLETNVKEYPIVDAMNATCDSFYGSQGRKDVNFEDRNDNLLDELCFKYPNLATLEMETFHLLTMGKSCKLDLKTSAATMIIAQRRTGEFLDNNTIKKMEMAGGEACLQALISFPLDTEKLMQGPECVWNNI